MAALLAQNGKLSMVSSAQSAHSHQLATPELSLLTQHQVIAGQVNMASLLQGQLAAGSQRESQAGRRVTSWAKCRAAAVAKDFPPEGEPGGQASDWVGRAQNRDFPFSHTPPMSTCQAPSHLEFGLFSRGSIVQAIWQCWQWVGK